jgi:mono/diheme cytochrome c family protein
VIPASIEKRLRALSPGFSPGLFRTILIAGFTMAFVIPIAVVALPYLEIFNDMAVQPKAKAQSVHGILLGEGEVVDRLPVEGTVPRSYVAYSMAGEGEEAAKLAGETLVNPLQPTMAVLEEGRKLFDRYCWTCHGRQGDGDGPIVGPELFPAPPSLHTDAARAFPDGRIYHVIMRGQNTMPSYADKLASDERWATIHYVRALQRARNPQAEDFDR